MSTIQEEIKIAERVAVYMNAFVECNNAIQDDIRELLQVIVNPETDEDDKIMTMHTLNDALFPHRPGGLLGEDLVEHDESLASDSLEMQEIIRKLDHEESTFAERLRAVLVERSITQQELADMIGVGQPAISNMLNRECRPQQRTVQRIADALDIPAEQLWSDADQ